MFAKLSTLMAAGALVLACKGKPQPSTPKATLPTSDDMSKVDPALCDTAGKNVVTFDLNKDNRPDVWRLYKVEDEGGTKVEFMTCKQVDFDHDGRKDWVVAYSRKGTALFEQADFDYDGKFDMTAVYDSKTSRVAEVDRDTDFDGTFDVKEIYDSTGALASVRRDRNGDEQPDQWEQYRDTVLIAILYDDDYDGKVDRRDEIPGAIPKVDMPATQDPTATEAIPESPAPGADAAAKPGADAAAKPGVDAAAKPGADAAPQGK